MNCPKCNAAIPAGKNFCVECGERLPEQTQVRKCVKCGAAIPNGKNFCVECGTPYASASNPNQYDSMKNTEQGRPVNTIPSSEKRLQKIVLIVTSFSVFINLIFLLISEFVFPQYWGDMLMVGLIIAAVPIVIFIGFTKTSLTTKFILYGESFLAMMLIGMPFCWESETVSKYRLGVALTQVFRNRDKSFSWRTDIGVKDDIYFVPLRKLNRSYNTAVVDLNFKRHYDESSLINRWKPADKRLTWLHMLAAMNGGSINVNTWNEDVARLKAISKKRFPLWYLDDFWED